MATLLARKGYRVLVVDKAAFPSDTLSTHIIWPRGVAVLARMGLLDDVVATNCPPFRHLSIRFGDLELRGAFKYGDEGDTGYCPRRYLLDKILVDAAAAAGAEVRERFTVEGLIWEGESVAGIKGHSRGAAPVEERARLVIGADGVHSFVARAVDAPEYNAHPPQINFYYSYFSGFDCRQIEQHAIGDTAIVCLPTNDALTLISGLWPSSRFDEIRADIDGNFRKLVAASPSVSERMRSARQEDKWQGTAGVPNYFRKPFGPGWALVGDAAYERDPISAQGISDALVEAEHLTQAIDTGFSGRRPLEETLTEYELARNARNREIYEFTLANAKLVQPPSMMQLFAAMRHNPNAADLLASVVAGSVPVSHFMNSENIGKILAQAATAN
jgi:2-polyprenyl-6-methoxyphenol hydroxylase-like FAD-dependent oxidoreductase